MRVQPRGGGTDERDHDEDAPQPVNHARDRGQQLDGDLQYILDPAGQRMQPRILGETRISQQFVESGGQKVLTEKNCNSQTENRTDSQSEYRTIQRPDDRRQNSELRVIRVPRRSRHKVQSVAPDRRHRLPSDAEDYPEDHQHGQPGDRKCGAAEKAIRGDLESRWRSGNLRLGWHHRRFSRLPAEAEDIARCSAFARGHEIWASALPTASTTLGGSGI